MSPRLVKPKLSFNFDQLRDLLTFTNGTLETILHSSSPSEAIPHFKKDRRIRNANVQVLLHIFVLGAVLVRNYFTHSVVYGRQSPFSGYSWHLISETAFAIYTVALFFVLQRPQKVWRVIMPFVDLAFFFIFISFTNNPETGFFFFLILPILSAADSLSNRAVITTALIVVVGYVACVAHTAQTLPRMERAKWSLEKIYLRTALPRALFTVLIAGTIVRYRRRSELMEAHLSTIALIFSDLNDFYNSAAQVDNIEAICAAGALFVKKRMATSIGGVAIFDPQIKLLYGAYMDQTGTLHSRAGLLEEISPDIGIHLRAVLAAPGNESFPMPPRIVREDHTDAFLHLFNIGQSTDGTGLLLGFDSDTPQPYKKFFRWQVTIFGAAITQAIEGKRIEQETARRIEGYEAAIGLLGSYRNLLDKTNDVEACDLLCTLKALEYPGCSAGAGALLMLNGNQLQVVSAVSKQPLASAVKSSNLKEYLGSDPSDADNETREIATALTRLCSGLPDDAACTEAMKSGCLSPLRHCPRATCAMRTISEDTLLNEAQQLFITPIEISGDLVGAFLWINNEENASIPDDYLVRELFIAWWLRRQECISSLETNREEQRRLLLTVAAAYAHDTQHVQSLLEAEKLLLNTETAEQGFNLLSEVIRRMKDYRAQLSCLKSLPGLGHQTLDEARINLVKLAIDTLNKSEATQERWGDILLRAPDTPVWVKGNQETIALVLRELLQNSIKHTAPDQKISVAVYSNAIDLKLPVRLNARSTSLAALVVEDEGCGFLMEDVEELKKPLMTTTGGSGCGWTIATLVTGTYGGAFEPRSEGVGRGSSCALLLPILSD